VPDIGVLAIDGAAPIATGRATPDRPPASPFAHAAKA
jgi:hypothetical protein